MALVYRTVLDVPPHALTDGVQDLFGEWVNEKFPGIGVDGSARADGREGHTESLYSAAGDLQAVRLRLREETGAEHWLTTITGIRDGDNNGWLWVDVERTATDVYGYEPSIAAPRIVREALDRWACSTGGEVLTSTAELVDGKSAPALVDRLLSSKRRVPLVVISEAHAEQREQAFNRAQSLARRVAGLARVVAITPRAAMVLEASLGTALAVADGATRTYFPTLNVSDPRPWRHPYVPYRHIKLARDQGSGRVAGGLARVLAGIRPPAIYAEAVRRMPGFPADPDRDPTALLEQVIDLEERLEQAGEKLAGAQDDWAMRGFELEDAERAARKAEAQIRFLEKQLREARVPVATLGEPDFEPSTCVGVVERARKVLPHLSIPSKVDEAAADLDRDANSGLYASKAWRALQALNDYAEVRSSDDSAPTNFLDYCKVADADRATYSAQKVALTESETTDNNDRFRALRHFSVDRTVDATGSMYMPAHLKLDMGGIFPRLHFYDDTRGGSRKLHIGYLGRHLDSTRRN